MSCKRITTSGHTIIQHDKHCAGRWNVMLCLFWLYEQEKKREDDSYDCPDSE